MEGELKNQKIFFGTITGALSSAHITTWNRKNEGKTTIIAYDDEKKVNLSGI